VYFTQIGLNAKDVALLISLTFLGGLIFQWPIGLCSDYFDRRKVIAVVMLGFTLITGAFAFFVDEHVYVLNNYLMILSFFLGGCAYTLYSLFISLANDFLQPKHVVKASAGLIIFHAVGAIIGPFLASLMMASIGAHGLFLYMMTINAVVFLFSIMRIMHGRGIPEATSENFVSMPKTSMGVMDLDPRQEDREENLG
jgi:MFS family permease